MQCEDAFRITNCYGDTSADQPFADIAHNYNEENLRKDSNFLSLGLGIIFTRSCRASDGFLIGSAGTTYVTDMKISVTFKACL